MLPCSGGRGPADTSREERLYVRNRGERGSSRGVAEDRTSFVSRGSAAANEVNRYQARVAAVSEIFKIPRPLHQSVPLFGSNCLLLQQKRFVAHSRRLRGRDQWSVGAWQDTRPGDGDWRVVPRLAVSCHHTADVSCSNRLPLPRAAGTGEGKKRRRLLREWPGARSSNRKAEVT